MKLSRTPPGQVDAREEFWTIGWQVSKLPSILPTLESTPDMQVDARSLAADSILAFTVSAVGDGAKSRPSIVGYSVIDSHRFGTTVHAEIEAFIVPSGK